MGFQNARLEVALAFLGVRGNLVHGFSATEPPDFGFRPSTLESHVVQSCVHLPLSYRAQWQSSAAAHLARHASSFAALHMPITAQDWRQKPLIRVKTCHDPISSRRWFTPPSKSGCEHKIRCCSVSGPMVLALCHVLAKHRYVEWSGRDTKTTEHPIHFAASQMHKRLCCTNSHLLTPFGRAQSAPHEDESFIPFLNLDPHTFEAGDFFAGGLPATDSCYIATVFFTHD